MRLACWAFAPFAETVQELMPCSSRLLKSGVKEGRIRLPSPFKCSWAQSFFSDWASRETSAALLTEAKATPPIAPRPILCENRLRFILAPQTSLESKSNGRYHALPTSGCDG